MTPPLLRRMAAPLLHLIDQLHFDNTNFLRGQSKVRSEDVLLTFTLQRLLIKSALQVCWPESPSPKKVSYCFGQLKLVACCVSQSTKSFCAGQDDSSSETKARDNDATSTVVLRSTSTDLRVENDVLPVTTVSCTSVSQAVL